MLLSRLHKPIYEKRIQVLSSLILESLEDGDRILDIGSGFGALGERLLKAAAEAGKGIDIQGLEKHPRGGEQIETLAFDGYDIPCENGHYDVVILADVVHHEEDYMRLLKEAARVTRRLLIIKDHTPVGFLGHARICFMDWAANSPYGVKCLYRYFPAARWRSIFDELGLEVVRELESIRLYPQPFNVLFGNRLQYFAAAAKPA